MIAWLDVQNEFHLSSLRQEAFCVIRCLFTKATRWSIRVDGFGGVDADQPNSFGPA